MSIFLFSTAQLVFTVEHYFRKQPCEAIKQKYLVHFPDAAVTKKSVADFLSNGAPLHRVSVNMPKHVELCPQWGGTFNVRCNYSLNM
jgi:hypothetical protein